MIQLMRWLFLAGTYGFLALFMLKNPNTIEKPLGMVTMSVRILVVIYRLKLRRYCNIKKLISLLTIFFVLIASLLVTASAAVYTEVFDYDFVDDYETFRSDSNGTIDFLFNTGFFGSTPSAYSGMDMPTGGIGRVFAFIACQDYEARSANSNEVVGNYVSCYIGLDSSYATKTQHIATRSFNNVTNGWDYTYVSDIHDDPTGPLVEIVLPEIR